MTGHRYREITQSDPGMSERERDNKPGGHIGRRLRESLERASEVVVIEHEQTMPARPFAASWVDYREYHDAQRLKSELLRRYRGQALEDVLPGEEVRTAHGVCYRLVSRDASRLRTVDPSEAGRRILSDLKLLYGVGEVTEAALKRQGVGSIADLADHPRFGGQARSILKMVEEGDTTGLLDWIGRGFQKSHPLALFSSGFHREEDFIFLDIETLGMFQRPIILLGLARVHGVEIRVEQYLLRRIDEEPAALAGLLTHLSGRRAFVTYNGRTFDIPYIRERLAYYGIRANLEGPHFDVLHFSRRAWRDCVPDCKLTTLESCFLGIQREDDVPSALVPEFYESYMRTGNPGPLVPIVEHNRRDLLTLASLFSKLHEEWQP
jgi:uncharacterized protein YprB with RNaseH-like and TPR domain